MKPWKLVALLVVVALPSAAIAFWFGLREGWNVGIMADSIPRGGISLHHIQKLSGGMVTRNTMTSLESDVDMALLWAYNLEHHPLRPILNAVWGTEILLNETSLRRLADYRKSHPSPLRPEALAAQGGYRHRRQAALSRAKHLLRALAFFLRRKRPGRFPVHCPE